MRPTAFVLLSSLAFATAANATPGERFYIQEDDTSVHETANAAAPVVMLLKRGDRVIEFRREGAWVKVGLLGAVGKDGWVKSSRLGPELPREPGAPVEEPEEQGVVGEIASPPKPAPEETDLVKFLLEVKGPPAREFRGDCRVITETGDEGTARIGGLLPKSYEIEAKAIRCIVSPFTLSRTMRLRVKLTAMLATGDEVYRATRGPYGSFIVSSPWDWY